MPGVVVVCRVVVSMRWSDAGRARADFVWLLPLQSDALITAARAPHLAQSVFSPTHTLSTISIASSLF